jgi:hypothetical protein
MAERRKPIDYGAMLGEQYGRLTVICPALDKPGDLDHRPRVICRCDCGSEIETRARCLRGGTKSCGCLNREIIQRASLSHGHAKRGMTSRTYRAWSNMHTRCQNPSNNRFEHYGGRGILVCERWNDFENFLADMGEVPPGLTLERDDVNGDYQPGNRRWAFNHEQQNNKRNNRRIEFRGETRTLSQWARRLGIPDGTIPNRLGQLGWPVERALTQHARAAGG